MYVVKRNGKKQKVHDDKITARIRKLCYGLDREFIDPVRVAEKVRAGIYNGIPTTSIDQLAAETAAFMTSEHFEYSVLAARIAVSSLHKSTQKSFSATAHSLFHYVEKKSGLSSPLLSEAVFAFIQEHADTLDNAIVYDRDCEYDYFGFKTLEKSYLLRLNGQIAERPQHMLMRVACGLHCGNIEAVMESYDAMSRGLFTHASPTLFNSGTCTPQLSSCFLLAIKGDAIDKIYDTLKDCAIISKHAGGIGLSVHDIRATGSYIRGTNGSSNGLVPMLRGYNNTARYVDQGGGKRKGAFAVYLEPWHADIFEFLKLKTNTAGAEEQEFRARDLFYGLWIPDLFMRRVEADEHWSLFCPREAPGLADVWGEKFDELYLRYEREGKARNKEPLKARKLYDQIVFTLIETGNPYILFKDRCNALSNQQHLGTIRSSNLCTEIIQYSAPDEIAVCNLASIALPKCVDLKKGEFDHQELVRITKIVTKNLNRIIDINFYPVKEAKKSNLAHRPIGIGVQGLADVFLLLGIPYESPEAQVLNRDIFETIYFAALTASNELAREQGTYESYEGSPTSRGLLHFDLCKVTPSERWDWTKLRQDIKQHGLRNSLLVAPMPTATTSQILGNNECFEPYTSNLYVRRTSAGEFFCVSKHLLRDLINLGLWNPVMKNKLVAAKGSVQGIKEIPAKIRELYKTVWEMKGQTLLDMAAARAAFIDQSQSNNVYMKDATLDKVRSMIHYAWLTKILKTAIYYFRTLAAADPTQFTVDEESLKQDVPLCLKKKRGEGSNDTDCMGCSS